MKIYTKTGDTGETGLFAGPRVRKDDLRIEAYGTVDELNSLLGVCRTAQLPAEIDAVLKRIQDELFAVGAELASPHPDRHGLEVIDDPYIEALEREIDQFETNLEPLRQFILPGGAPAAAFLHMARTVCRRAERRVVTLAMAPVHPASPRLVRYLNRVGDLLFVLARAANHAAGVVDVPWTKPAAPTS